MQETVNPTPAQVAEAESFWQKYPIVRQFAKFVVIGFVNTGIDFLVLNIEMALTGIHDGPYMFLLNAVSFAIATVNSYFLNRKWAFQDNSSEQGKQFSQFIAVSLVGVVINSTIVYTITTYVSPIVIENPVLWANLAKVAATGISLIWNFLGYKFFVFKK